jgi:4-amino-4-deoxy-L-arabinose transferase-like glycosyltransferase
VPAGDPRLRALRAIDVLVLTLVLAAALAWPLRSPPIAAHGEAREGLVVQDIVARGEWVLPHRNGELPSKPPLFHWLAAGAAHVFGLSDASVRSPSAVAAALMLLATYAFGAASGGRAAGWLAAGALLGTYGFWEAAWQARVDMVFAACITIALVAFFAWYRSGGRLARAACYLAAGGAVLAKGPAGAVLPALVVAVFVGRESWRRRAETGGPLAHARLVRRRLWSWPLALLVLGVDLGWYALAFRRGGVEFLAVQLVHENVDRLVGRGVFGLHGGRSRFALLGELATDLVPWNLVLVWTAIAWLRGARAAASERFLHAWWLVVVGVFTAAYGKRDVYLLPLYPAIALLAGRALAAHVASGGRLFGVVAVPNAIRRRFPARPALALLALAIVAFDVTLAGVGELVRVQRAHRRSLLAFVPAVAAAVPPDVPLYAAGELAGSDVQVLAYRLRRSIPRAPASADALGAPAYVLVRASSAEVERDPRARRIAVSTRRGSNVALVAIAR